MLRSQKFRQGHFTTILDFLDFCLLLPSMSRSRKAYGNPNSNCI